MMRQAVLWFLLVLFGPLEISTLEPIDVSKCDTGTKGCMLMPLGCAAITNSPTQCSHILTYTPLNGSVLFELQAPLVPDKPMFAAVGFSTSGKMEYTAVTACIWNPTETAAHVGLFYNKGGHSDSPVNTSGLPAEVATLVEAGAISATFVCRFRQLITPPQNNEIFLLNANYTLLIASGESNGERLSYHRSNRFASADKVNVAVAGNNGTAGGDSGISYELKTRLIKAHGCLMVFAWWVFVPTAILIARYLKNVLWPQKLVKGAAPWFHFHRYVQVTALLLALTASVCMGIAVGFTWVGTPGAPQRNHAISGLACLFVLLLQPVFAAFRCGPEAKYRPLFTWPHRIIGIVAFFTSCYTISEARSIFYPWTADQAANATGVMIFYWITVALIVLGMEFHECIMERFQRHCSRNGTVTFTREGLQPIAEYPKTSTNQPSENQISTNVIKVRVVLVALFITCAAIATISLCILIATAN